MAGESFPIPLGGTPAPVEIDEGTLVRTKSPSPGPIGLKDGDARAAQGGGSASIGASVLQFARDRRGQRAGGFPEALRSAARDTMLKGPLKAP